MNYFGSPEEITQANLNLLFERMFELEGGMALQGVKIDVDGLVLQSGNVDVTLAQVTRPIILHGQHGLYHLASEVTIYLTPFDQVIAQERKQLLLSMGVAFMLFGFVLQWVLQRVLTAPFFKMVDTADQISSGDNTARFDQQRDDEFGFLAKFINRSLDNLTQQKDELADIVVRITESEAALYKEKERVEITLQSISEAVVATDAMGLIDFFNPVAERLTGWQCDDAIGRHVDEVIRLVEEDSGEGMLNPISQAMSEVQVVMQESGSSLMRHDGTLLPVSESAAPICDHENQVVGAIMVLKDVTPTRRLAKELSYQASHDALTGLFNRNEFEDRLQSALERVHEGEGEHALCYIDLDQFKVVNDTCGHMAGDELLRQLSHLLDKQMRELDVLARLGGDEIGVLLVNSDIDEASEVSERLLRVINDFRFVWEDRSFEVGASIGVVAVTAENINVSELMSAADVACYAAKDLGRNRVHLYKPDDHEMAQRHGEMQWVSRIKRAMEEDRFCLYYQPIVPVDPESDAQPHYEALIRLKDERGDLVPPMAFIPAAERYNLMPMIDRWVIRTALDYKLESSLKCGDYICAINLSGASLSDDAMLDYTIDAINNSKVPHEDLIFEITETAAISNLEQAERFINALHELGCRFALDDFGSGLSSFAYLKNLKVDFLKIDGSFVRDMATDPVDRAMVEAIHRVGQSMGIKTIAEFVEDEAILQALRELGVDYAQGYHLAMPRSMDECGEFFGGCCPIKGDRGVAIFAKVCFGHPSPSKQQKLHATVYACGAPTVLRTLPNHLFAALHNSLSDSTPT
ncbi:EAL domain-containing protein [Candidatus Reidiella endopervernicosa]|uniref:EAL domain-containing protein n=2 Tax=Candidatus Reidiella endopervernicosa TaxID=2738883 RepID=A0A6N0HYW0_9GAMM|nr:EAL domain-containing protein [Candidatus Reidiella endopervernicosa]